MRRTHCPMPVKCRMPDDKPFPVSATNVPPIP